MRMTLIVLTFVACASVFSAPVEAGILSRLFGGKGCSDSSSTCASACDSGASVCSSPCAASPCAASPCAPVMACTPAPVCCNPVMQSIITICAPVIQACAPVVCVPAPMVRSYATARRVTVIRKVRRVCAPNVRKCVPRRAVAVSCCTPSVGNYGHKCGLRNRLAARRAY